MEKKAEKRMAACFLLCLLFLGALFLYRQFYGFNKNDEIYYLSMARRFVQGDGMLVDEWNNGQLFTFLLYPFVSFLTWFLKGTEGIVLVTRICFVLFQAAAAGAVFWLLKKQGLAAAVCAVSYFVFAPFNISAFSYNTLAFTFLLLIFAAAASGREWGRRGWFMLGILAAFAVLSNPYLLFLYAAYGICCIVNTAGRKKRAGVVCWNSFFWLSAGAVLVLVVFLAFVFSRGSLSEIMQDLRYIVNDAERQKPFLEKSLKYAQRMWRYYKYLFCAGAGCVFAGILDRQKKIPRGAYLWFMSAVAALYLFYYGFAWDHVPINFLQVPLSFVGLTAYAVAPCRNKNLFCYWYLPALFATYLVHMAADTGILAVSSFYGLVSAASICLLWDCIKGCKKRRAAAGLFLVLCGIQIFATACQRIVYVWGDAPLAELDSRITKGPLKGICTTRENEELYSQAFADLGEAGLTEDSRLLVAGLSPWIYLGTPARAATYTTWEIPAGDRLLSLYYLKEERLPDVVYIPEEAKEEADTGLVEYFLERGYTERQMPQGARMLTHPGRQGRFKF